MMVNFLKKILHKSQLVLDVFYKEKHRLTYFPRYQIAKSSLLSPLPEVYFTDGKSFLAAYEEIFERENYKFTTFNKNPVIIDCGSNIGLSIIYFKQKYPNSIIYGFEPDPKIFDILYKNISSLNLKDVHIEQKAIWDKETELAFQQQGGSSGKISTSSSNSLVVKTIRLYDFLRSFTHIDFLKIDIEGSEYIVVKDCEAYLQNINQIFIEYHSEYNEEQHLGEILEILKRNNFRYIIKEASSPSYPFMEKEGVGFDFQVEIFAYRNEK